MGDNERKKNKNMLLMTLESKYIVFLWGMQDTKTFFAVLVCVGFFFMATIKGSYHL